MSYAALPSKRNGLAWRIMPTWKLESNSNTDLSGNGPQVPVCASHRPCRRDRGEADGPAGPLQRQGLDALLRNDPGDRVLVHERGLETAGRWRKLPYNKQSGYYLDTSFFLLNLKQVASCNIQSFLSFCPIQVNFPVRATYFACATLPLNPTRNYSY